MAGAGSRAERRSATEVALRASAVRLIAERGYEATSTDDIARAAGVSPRTFFNYFPTKESVVLLPDGLLAEVVGAALRRRPLGEDVAVSLAATALDVATSLEALAAGAEGSGVPGELMVSMVRVMFVERPLHQVLLERRAATEEAIWEVLRERGTAAGDLGARGAVATVVSLTYLGLRTWVEGEGAEPLRAVVARCLLSAPDPARFAVGVTTD
jgi:AcrR family transcriptional regulator